MIEFSQRNMKMWSRLGPSGALGVAAKEIVMQNPKVLMLTSDLCFFSGLSRFKTEFPENFYNFGISEQNMVGAAGGLAKEGFIPFANTYASFCSSRCADQVRVNMSYMNLPIKLIGLTSGFAAGVLGATHMSIEDVAVMRALPNIQVISPADCTEIVKSIIEVAKTDKPTYIRLTGPAEMPIIYDRDYDFIIGKAIEIKSGTDICLMSSGSILNETIKASNILEEEGFSCTIINMHTIKPIDEKKIEEVAKKHKLLVTVEEHSAFGGLGSAVCEYLADKPYKIPVLRIGVKDFFPHAGSYHYLLDECGLSPDKISGQIIEYVKSI